MVKFKKFTEKYLDTFFQDNWIEDDNLFEFLKGREGILTVEEDNEDEMILNIKIKLTEL
jgi:hypothetical protein